MALVIKNTNKKPRCNVLFMVTLRRRKENFYSFCSRAWTGIEIEKESKIEKVHKEILNKFAKLNKKKTKNLFTLISLF